MLTLCWPTPPKTPPDYLRGAIETAEEFGKRLCVEDWKRGWSRAQKKVVPGDGAEWIWNLARQHLPVAIQIVDLFHARQHLWDLVRKLYPNDEREQKRWIRVQKNRLAKGKIEKLVLALQSIQTSNPDVAEKLRTETEYFQINTERMRYPEFRAQHPFVGSGVIEAGCKTAHPGLTGPRHTAVAHAFACRSGCAAADESSLLRLCRQTGSVREFLGIVQAVDMPQRISVRAEERDHLG